MKRWQIQSLEEEKNMQRILSILAFSAVFSMLALADSWSGRLIDANCYNQQKKADGCDAMSSTTAFALEVSGKVYKFDAGGNSKATTALKSRADRAADPNKPQSNQVMAKVDGTEKGGTIAVENIDVQ
jgi:hypothetical protein